MRDRREAWPAGRRREGCVDARAASPRWRPRSRRARGGAAPRARGGGRAARRRCRDAPSRLRASSRSARGARRAAPWACHRRRRRGSAGGGSGRCPRPRRPGRIRSLRTSARRWTSTGALDAVADQRLEPLARELLALDRRGLEDRALARPEPVEPGGDQRLDRRGDRERGQFGALAPSPSPRTGRRRRRAWRRPPRRTAGCPRRGRECALPRGPRAAPVR